ncbi:metallophosphoesterase family protein [Mesorhizobium sp. ASY16-5R]|uniref:metallophosphoesterase family protein n=1 Tax=Mesorhizobium sp. ASY16-5R TaxID=3445772 RepID=UPI003F9F2B6C
MDIGVPGFLFALMLSSGIACAQEGGDKPIGILLAAGDIAYCNPDKAADEATAAIIRREVDQADHSSTPLRVLALGDLAYPNGDKNTFKCFDDSWGTATTRKLPDGKFDTILLPVWGNHDKSYFYAYFSNHPFVNQNGADKAYYVVNFPDAEKGPWRLFGLNPYVDRKNQMDWVDREIAGNPSECAIAFMHPYQLSSGHHGHDNGKSKKPVTLKLMREDFPVFQLLHKHKVGAVISGHDHDYEQFSRHDAEGKADPTGPRSFVVGTGGAGLYPTKQTSKWGASEFFQNKSRGMLKLELYADHYKWSFLNVEGEQPIALPVSEDTCAPKIP